MPVLRRGGFGKVFQEIQILFRDPVGDVITVAAPAKIQQVVHPVDQDGGFAAPGPRQQQQRPLRRQHALPLHSVHAMVPAGNDCPPGGDISVSKILCHKHSPPAHLQYFSISIVI